jgi:hypothetical protein
MSNGCALPYRAQLSRSCLLTEVNRPLLSQRGNAGFWTHLGHNCYPELLSYNSLML